MYTSTSRYEYVLYSILVEHLQLDIENVANRLLGRSKIRAQVTRVEVHACEQLDDVVGLAARAEPAAEFADGARVHAVELEQTCERLRGRPARVEPAEAVLRPGGGARGIDSLHDHVRLDVAALQ